LGLTRTTRTNPSVCVLAKWPYRHHVRYFDIPLPTYWRFRHLFYSGSSGKEVHVGEGIRNSRGYHKASNHKLVKRVRDPKRIQAIKNVASPFNDSLQTRRSARGQGFPCDIGRAWHNCHGQDKNASTPRAQDRSMLSYRMLSESRICCEASKSISNPRFMWMDSTLG